MEKYGADSLRFWAAGSKLGEDMDYQEKDLVTGKKFITKLFNASKFVFMGVGKSKPKKPKKLEHIDSLFLDKTTHTVNEVAKYFETYEYSKAKQEAETFFYKIFTDNYLEIVKKRIYRGKGEEKLSAQYTLYNGLLSIIKMIAPIMPFITEEIYQIYYRKHEKEKSIHLSKWPESGKGWIEKWTDEKVKSHANKLTLFSALLTQVRTEKTNNKKPMNAECIITISKIHKEDLGEKLDDFKNVTNAREIKTGKFKVEFK
jgi:valyl-tRNA synthetase